MNGYEHGIDFVVEFRMFDQGDEEDGRTERMSDVGHFWLFSHREDVVDAGRNVVVAHLIPTVDYRLKWLFGNSIQKY